MDSFSRFFALVTLAVLFLSVSYAEISTTFSVEERNSVNAKAITSLSSPSSLRDAFFATGVLDASKSAYTCNCASIGKLLAKTTSTIDIYYGISSSNACKCGLEASKDAKSAVTKQLKVCGQLFWRLYNYFESIFSNNNYFFLQ